MPVAEAVTSQSTAWRRLLIYTHRWLGITGSLLFVSWFVTGIVLMYAGMPVLSRDERLLRAPTLDLSAVRVGVSEAAVQAGFMPARTLVGMYRDRPVYRLAGGGGWTTVYADTGQVVSELTAESAVAITRGFIPEYGQTAQYDVRLTEPDQWTLQSRAFFPLHRVRVNDAADTVVYVSDRTAEPVMVTTARSRRWAYAGAVLHWWYFTPVRSRATLWANLVIGVSILGCLLCVSGLLWGMWRLSLTTTYRLRAGRSHSPYAGLMRWHHYGGLLFGVVCFTWVFSGGLSMEPWNWHSGTTPTRVQRDAVTGGSFRLGLLQGSQLRAGLAAIRDAFEPKELEVLQFRGEVYLWARDPLAGPDAATRLPTTLASLSTQAEDQRMVSVDHPELGAFPRFDADVIEGVAAAAMPGSAIVEASWLRRYDAYYYGRNPGPRLPVLRVRYDDPDDTWLYFDPYRGVIARKEERLTRLNRWLYHGLHSLDFPFLYARRPLWDVVVILLSCGGLLVSITSLSQGWRRLRRQTVELIVPDGRSDGSESAP